MHTRASASPPPPPENNWQTRRGESRTEREAGRSTEKRKGGNCRNRYKGKETERNYTLPFGASLLLISDCIGASLVACTKRARNARAAGVTMETRDKYNKGNYALFAEKAAGKVRSSIARLLITFAKCVSIMGSPTQRGERGAQGPLWLVDCQKTWRLGNKLTELTSAWKRRMLSLAAAARIREF